MENGYLKTRERLDIKVSNISRIAKKFFIIINILMVALITPACLSSLGINIFGQTKVVRYLWISGAALFFVQVAVGGLLVIVVERMREEFKLRYGD